MGRTTRIALVILVIMAATPLLADQALETLQSSIDRLAARFDARHYKQEHRFALSNGATARLQPAADVPCDRKTGSSCTVTLGK